MKLYSFRRRISCLMIFLVLAVPFGAILANLVPSASIVPKAWAQTWVQFPTTWMNVTGGPGVPNWIFRVGYPSSPFTVNIEVAGVTDLFAWELKLSWNASLVDFVSANEGDFLSGGVPSTTDFYSQVFEDQLDLDYVLVNCTLLSGAGKTGSGIIATVDFDLDASATAGSTPLDLYETKMRDSGSGIVGHGLTDGFVLLGDNQAYPLVYVLPQTVVADPGEMFNVTVMIDNVESLQAWGFSLYWLNTLLEATNIVNHVFLEGPSFGVQGLDNGAQSKAYATQTLAGPQPGTYGSGPLATITFMVEAPGRSVMNLVVTDNGLIGIYYNPPDPVFTYPLPHDVFDGLFRSSKPVASFMATPQPFTVRPAVNQTILFNATGSYDPGGLSITSYFWEFGDGNTTTENDPLITHAYKSQGSYDANLTVTNSEGKLSETSLNVYVVVRDIAVTEVRLSHIAVMPNQLVNISVTVRNEGTDQESLQIQTYVENASTKTLLGDQNIPMLIEGVTVTRYFVWDTTGYSLDDYTIQGIVPPLIAENDVGDNEINVPIALTYFNEVDYPAPSENLVFHVFVESNSTLSYPSPFMPSSFRFNRTALEISFNVTGSGGSFSYCNATVPKGLMISQPLDAWTILFDGTEVTDRIVTENATHTFIYFSYTLSEHKVQIIGTQIPIPPVAAFAVAPVKQLYFTGEILSFNAAGSTDPDGQIAVYFFDFDDDSNATGTANYDGTGNLIDINWIYREQGKTPQSFTTLTPEVGHNFTRADATDFTLNVTLTVTDNVGFTDTDFVLLRVFYVFDIAITAITTPNKVNITEMASVNVTIISRQRPPPSIPLRVNVTLYGNETMLATGTFLAPSLGATLEAQFTLNTTRIGLGTWTLNATAEVIQYGTLLPPDFPAEDPSDLSDNQFTFEPFTIKKSDTILTVQVTPLSLTYGSQAIISGQFNPAIVGINITLESKLGSASFVNLTTVSTKVGGQFQYLWTPSQAGTYEIRARFLGDAFTSSNVSATQTVVVKQVSSSVSIDVTPSSVSLGSSVSMSGRIDPTRSNVQVTVYYRLSGGTWASLPATSTDAQGNYAVQWQPDAAGTYDVQARWTGDVNTAASESDIKQLTVGGGGWVIDPLYIVAAVVIIVVAVAVFFFLRRKNAQ